MQEVQQQIVRIDRITRSPVEGETRERMVEAVRVGVREVDALLISDYENGVISQDLLDICLPEARRHGCRIIVDAHGDLFRFRDITAAADKLRARGGKIVFLRLPHSGGLKALEDRTTPRTGIWDRVIKDTAAPGIYYEDFPELSGFNCPEWSHLSAGDSVEFSKRLVPHLRNALQL